MSNLLAVQYFVGGSFFGAIVALICIALAMKVVLAFGGDDEEN